ncbi:MULTISPECIES: flagellar basal body rod C-terminal domain-containing protein [Undibacterium]|uniref:Flagellar hook-associated protein 1 n=1 Tax=Undibacterium parvum TaxID=401471 RepID=A0A3S9HMS9_9BURK|nr:MULTISPECIES: flagellar basal body rod C-terminal domain-containing protein [Undibacterium]AZP13427.1 hypothetical protein EJN92_16400 [Undibacterium parvum]
MSITALNTGLSGLKAYQGALDSSAHNIANANTAGFVPQQTQFQESKTGGVLVTISKEGSLAAQTATAETLDTSTAASGTELADELVSAIQSQFGFDFSAKIVKTADELLGTVINISA